MSSIDSAQNPTHQRFVRDLVVDSGFAAIFVNYTPSPEAHNPTAINEAYAATTWVAEHGDEISRFKAFDPGI
jgi:acetyl esterase